MYPGLSGFSVEIVEFTLIFYLVNNWLITLDFSFFLICFHCSVFKVHLARLLYDLLRYPHDVLLAYREYAALRRRSSALHIAQNPARLRLKRCSGACSASVGGLGRT